MVNHTRLDCLLGATTGLRRGTLEAIHHARHRSAFGKLLVDQPAMRNVLADLAVESEAATVVGDAGRALVRRGRRRGHGLPPVRDRGDEVLGLQARAGPRGRGARVPRRQRLHRGLGDAAAVPRRPAGLDLGGLRQRRGARRAAGDGQGARGAAGVHRPSASSRPVPTPPRRPPRARAASGRRRRSPGDDPQFEARRVVEDLALALQGSLLVRHAPPAVADAFCATRLAGEGGRVYGTLPAGVDAGAIIDARVPGLADGGRRVRVRRADRPPDPEPARARQRPDARAAVGARAVRRAGGPGPRRPRAAARRQRQGVLRRLRPGVERRGPAAEPRPGRAVGPDARLRRR